MSQSTKSTRLHPLQAGNAPALLAFYHGLSPATLHTFRPLRQTTTLARCEEIIRANLLQPPQRYDLAAWDGPTMVGWAFLERLDQSAPHLGLGIADPYQGQGVGSALLDELLQWATAQQIGMIELMVVKDNDHAIHLYRSRGFTSYTEKYDEDDALTYLHMRLQLQATLPLHISLWSPDHPRIAQAEAVIAALGQTDWVNAHFAWHLERLLLVATRGGQVVGFLRLVTQHIGSDEELPLTEFRGTPLLESKVLGFGVLPEQRRQGIGRALQEAALRVAKERGCYQLRSHSSGTNIANHQLKLAMGFALHRIVRGEDRRGGYFVMPLQTLYIKT